ncbi:MAG: aerobic respiration control sensor protein ArcB [Methanomethylovorans sp. PtaU1.Bin093]|uniref:PAS domain S-box protein n=2 Tax=Methanomethylovorans TaxID=101191 RepID=UPI0009D489A1|nr:PAS domain S-box protein [Methanomethylovorans sp. PtaU1.Bin093]OPY18370.1 MAG: aerobic respiration control sensor protein ArcB [Methanomethylovorans sp. PtaU1.Bin093]
MNNKARSGMQYELSVLESCRTVLGDTYTGTELKSRSEFLTVFLDTVPLPVFYKDVCGKYLGCNKAFEQFIGKTREEIIGNTMPDTWPKEFAEKYESMDRELFETPGKQTYEWQITLSDGSKKEVIFHNATYSDASGKTAGIIGVIQDVTELVQAISLLEESGKDLRSILHSSTESIILIDVSGIVLDANEVAAHRLKTDLEMFKGKNAYDFLAPEVAENRRKMVCKVIAEGRPIYFEDERYGATVLNSIYPIFDKDGKVERLAIFGMDITAARRVESTLQNHEELYRDITGTALDGYLYVSFDGIILEANEAYCMLSGYTLEELLGMHISDLEANESYEQTATHICKVIESGKDRFETKHRTKNGNILDIEVTTAYSEKTVPGFFSFFRDVTEHKQTEEREQHLKKVLLAIRKATRSIIRASDPDVLIRQVCADLTATPGYLDAWIVLADEKDHIRPSASGIGSEREIIREQLERGKYPFCMISALENNGIIVIDQPDPNCGDCALPCRHVQMSRMVRRLHFEGRIYGILTVLVPTAFAHEKEEQELFIGIADDLGFALHKMTTENA